MRSRTKDKRNKFGYLLPFASIFLIVILFSSSSFYQKSWYFDWNEIRLEVKDSILIYEHQPITSGVGSEGVSTSHEVERRHWIMGFSTIKELKHLTSYPDGTIKAIAYEGLLRNPNIPNKKEIILEAINDNKVQGFDDNEHIVAFQSGCLVWDLSLAEYLVRDVLHLVGNYPPPPPKSRLDIDFSDADKHEIIAFYEEHQIEN